MNKENFTYNVSKYIEKKEIISSPNAAVKVERITLTEEAKKSLTIPSGAMEWICTPANKRTFRMHFKRFLYRISLKLQKLRKTNE
jgi:hypothetical protein